MGKQVVGQRHDGLPETGYVRLWQIIGDKKKGIVPLIPVSKSVWYDGIKHGRYPTGVKLSEKITAWPVDSIRQLIKMSGGNRP